MASHVAVCDLVRGDFSFIKGHLWEVGLSLPQVVKKVLKKVILLKSTEESTKKCTQKVLKLKRTKKSTL